MTALRRIAGNGLAVLIAIWLLAAPSAQGAPRTSVIDGIEATAGSFPYLAFVLREEGTGGGRCSGTVVSSNVVLTAAHCVLTADRSEIHPPASFHVVTGNVNWTSNPRTISTVSRIAVNPNFAYLVPSGTPVRADVAVLGLSQPIVAPPISIATAKIWEPGTLGLMAGWGETVAGAPAPTTLHYGGAVVQSNSFCESEFAYHQPSWNLCVLDYPEYEYASCSGDSGGPLLKAGPGGEPVQIGIASFGTAGCPTDRPSYYARVDSVAGWIQKKVGEYAPPVAPPSPAQPETPPLPTLTRAQAESLARTGLRLSMGGRFAGHRALRIACVAIDSTRRRCNVSWWVGDRDYRGSVTVFFALEGGQVVWNYRYTIRQASRRCLYMYSAGCPVRTYRR